MHCQSSRCLRAFLGAELTIILIMSLADHSIPMNELLVFRLPQPPIWPRSVGRPNVGRLIYICLAPFAMKVSRLAFQKRTMIDPATILF
jgi:hypothetical protein